MSLFFPVHRPRVGLSFTERGIALVELRRGWGKPVITRVSERPLPDGALRPSATEPNMHDRSSIEKELRALLQHTSERTAAMCLPDQACHLAVFPFETLPAREQDRDRILRWRFQHEAHVAIGDARILHRVFPVRETAQTAKRSATQEGQVAAYVLAMAIARSVFGQYEQVCQQAGVLPMSISCASLWLFDFYRPLIAQAAELFFVHQASDSMTFLAIRQGRPVFCRTKGRRRGQTDLMSEIWSTVQSYEDVYPHAGTTSDPISVPIYMVGDGFSQVEGFGGQALEFNGEGEVKTTGYKSMPIGHGWKTVVSLKTATVSSQEGLYALACVGGR